MKGLGNLSYSDMKAIKLARAQHRQFGKTNADAKLSTVKPSYNPTHVVSSQRSHGWNIGFDSKQQ